MQVLSQRTLTVLFLSFFLVLTAQSQQDPSSKIESGLVHRLTQNPELAFFIEFNEQLNTSELDLKNLSKLERAKIVFTALRNIKDASQKELIKFLEEHQASYQSFIIANVIRVKGSVDLIQELAKFEEVKRIYHDPLIRNEKIIPAETITEREPGEPEWGIKMIQADKVWEMGYRGGGIIIGGQDTGYDWDQPLLKERYRGWSETAVDHNYNWHDAIHELNPLHNDTINDPSINPCGLDSQIPCDDHNHGTHTMGTMVGEDEENKIGVSPDSKWIGCRNMERGYGSPGTYLECFEFFLAPTDLNGENPDVSMAPHVINNSWRCPEMEGCNAENWGIMETAIENLKASGIVVVVSAGNSGSECGTIDAPAAMFDASFTIGASKPNDTIAGFSSRGLVNIDESLRMKPNVIAPGVQVRSIIRDSSFVAWNGTSMAGPHVAGAVALIISSNPYLEGKVELIEDILEQTADQKTTDQECHDTPGTEIPNPIYGFGRINVYEAVLLAQTYSSTNDEDHTKDLFLYPNPATDQIFIKSSPGAVIRLYDNSGKLIIQTTGGLNDEHQLIQLNISKLPSGLYFCTLLHEGKFISQKLVKN